MQALKAMLAKKKGQVGISFSRAQQQKKRVQQFKKQQQKIEQQKQKKLTEKLKEIGQFCQPKKKTKAGQIFNEQQQQIEFKNKQTSQKQKKPAQQSSSKNNDQAQIQQTVNEQILNKKRKDDQQYEQLEGKLRHLLIQPKLLEQVSYRTKKQKMLQLPKQKETTLADKCDQILLWLKKILKIWVQTLQFKYNTQQIKIKQGKEAFKLYYQAYNHLQPLFTVLRARQGDIDMIESIYHIMNCCLLRNYREANDRYIQMSIGNAPWPMGAIMLGITVRKNTPRLAHVLNDPISRRWTQSIKRLITVSQQLYPNQDNTKMVLYSVASIFG